MSPRKADPPPAPRPRTVAEAAAQLAQYRDRLRRINVDIRALLEPGGTDGTRLSGGGP